MNRKIGALGVLFLLLLVPLGQVNANSGGRFNSSGGRGCHGGAGGVTAQLTGLPAAYEALTTYTLTVGMSTSPGTGGFNNITIATKITLSDYSLPEFHVVK